MNTQLHHKGFTLVELLVVMVIVSATTTLLISGFSITWKNFSRLSQRDLMLNGSLMGERWLRESINEAVLFHPNQPRFYGDAERVEFTTLSAPWTNDAVPLELTWSLQAQESGSQLQLTAKEFKAQLIEFPPGSEFQYQRVVDVHSQQWRTSFAPSDAELPSALRIVHDNRVIFYARFKRPGQAEVPVEMKVFGEYEFGG